jgi:hypothetical protein
MPLPDGYARAFAVNAKSDNRQIPLAAVYRFTLTNPAAIDADGYFVDVAGPDTTTITLNSGSAEIGALWSGGVARPDFPRNVVITVTDVSAVVAQSGTITGYDILRNVITEAWSVTASGTSKTFTGAKSFAEVTSVTVTAASDASTNVIDIGTGKVFGLPVKVSATNRDAAVAELVADHASFRTTATETKTLVDELHDDAATNKTLIDELKTDYTALLADVAAIRTAYNATLAKLDADGGVTDTNYAATNPGPAATATSIAASSAATLTATKPTAPPAAISASGVGNSDGLVVAASTSASADSRGTFAPTTTPDGSLDYSVWVILDNPEDC